MRNMTKIVVLLLVFALLFGMVACQDGTDTTSDGGGESVEPEAAEFEEFLAIGNIPPPIIV